MHEARHSHAPLKVTSFASAQRVVIHATLLAHATAWWRRCWWARPVSNGTTTAIRGVRQSQGSECKRSANEGAQVKVALWLPLLAYACGKTYLSDWKTMTELAYRPAAFHAATTRPTESSSAASIASM